MGQVNLAPKRRPAPRTLLVAFLAFSVAAPSIASIPSTLRAQPKGGKANLDEARARFERGKQLYEEGAFDAALIEFQRAYDLAPSYRILFNIGQVHRQQNDYAGALRAYERYLSEGGAEIDAKRRGEVEKEVASLKGRVATLQITANVTGAEVSIDDVSMGKTPLPGPLTVNAGRRRVTLSIEGRVPITKVVTLAGSDTLTVPFELLSPNAPPAASLAPRPAPPLPTATATQAASNAPPPPPPPAEKSNAPLIGWVATGVLAAGAVVGGVLALSAASNLKSERDRQGATRDSLDSAKSKTKNTALVTDILTGAALVAGGISIYLTVTSPSAPSTQTGRVFAPQQIRLGLGAGSVSLGGSFLARWHGAPRLVTAP